MSPNAARSKGDWIKPNPDWVKPIAAVRPRLTHPGHPGKEPAFIRNGCGAQVPAPPIGKNPARFLGS